MPGVLPPADEHLSQLLGDLRRRVRALETQQQLAITTSAGEVVMNVGHQADGTYGIQVIDAAGYRRIEIGKLPDGSFGIAYFSPANDGTWTAVT